MTAAKQIEWVSVEDYLARELTSDVKHEYLGGSIFYGAAGAMRSRHFAVISKEFSETDS
jgi:hypothetical protein